MKNPFERKPVKGLMPRELKKVRNITKGVRWQEGDVNTEDQGSMWGVHDSPLNEMFESGHIRENEHFEGLGVTPEDLKSWVASMHESGRKVSSVDVMGQSHAGLQAGVDKAYGWEFTNTKHLGISKEQGEEAILGDVFHSKPRRQLLEKLDADAKNGTELGIVFFRPVAGVQGLEGSKYAQVYLYEFILRPLYERLAEEGMVFMASVYLDGMPILKDLLAASKGFELVSNRGDTAYMLRKKTATSTLASISDLSEDVLKGLEHKFEDIQIDGIHNPLWRQIRRTLAGSKRSR